MSKKKNPDPLIERLRKEKDTDKVIMHLVTELKICKVETKQVETQV